jgi:hypothetical protein
MRRIRERIFRFASSRLVSLSVSAFVVAQRYCCCFVVDESFVTVFSAAVPGPEGSDLTSTLLVLLLDSDVVAGAGVAGAGAADAAGGACWHPTRIRPKAVRAKAARNLPENGFI